MEKYEIGLACSDLQDFVWNDFCDWYIELCKPSLYGEDGDKKDNTLGVLVYVLTNTLKLLHPYIPFITEEIYQNTPNKTGSIMVSDYPRYNSKANYKKDAEKTEIIMNIIKSIRQIRVDTGCAPSKKVDLFIVSEHQKLIEKNSIYIEKLANIGAIKFIPSKDALDMKVVSQVLDKVELYVPLGELVDATKELQRLEGELSKIESEIARANGKLANQGFLAKAPKSLVDSEREKLDKFIDMRAKIMQNIKEIKEM
jgi:valyl-tRNA synthetase